VATVSRVTLTTRKPPQALAGAPFGTNRSTSKVPAHGDLTSAAEAVPAFPANNVAAAQPGRHRPATHLGPCNR
jgi:hypothetical protein